MRTWRISLLLRIGNCRAAVVALHEGRVSTPFVLINQLESGFSFTEARFLYINIKIKISHGVRLRSEHQNTRVM
jgi:hypothetical protein